MINWVREGECILIEFKANICQTQKVLTAPALPTTRIAMWTGQFNK